MTNSDCITKKMLICEMIICDSVNQVDLTDLGVGPNDYLIINDVVEDDVSEIASDCKLKGDNGGGSLTFALNECNPTVEVSSASPNLLCYVNFKCFT